MNATIETLCPACRKCKYVDVEQTKLWADDEIYQNLYFCKHLKICKNAVEIWNTSISCEEDTDR